MVRIQYSQEWLQVLYAFARPVTHCRKKLKIFDILKFYMNTKKKKGKKKKDIFIIWSKNEEIMQKFLNKKTPKVKGPWEAEGSVRK